MARFTADDGEKYGGQGNGSFFSLQNDKDVATVRFMYNDINDVEGYSVHEVDVDGKKRYVDCLRTYNEPVDSCPLCAARMKVIAKYFVPIYDMTTEEVKIWDRGRTFLSKLSSLCARYTPLVSTPFEIERRGKKGDTNTEYETFASQPDGIGLEDLPELPVILGGLVLDKSFEELEYYAEYGEFEPEDEAVPVRRSAGRPVTPPESQRAATAPRTRARAPEPEEEAPPAEPVARRGTRRK